MSSFPIRSRLFATNQTFAQPHILGHINVYVSHFCMSAYIYSVGVGLHDLAFETNLAPRGGISPQQLHKYRRNRYPSPTTLKLFQTVVLSIQQCMLCKAYRTIVCSIGIRRAPPVSFANFAHKFIDF